ncbi:SH2 domain protein [Dictyocaulus viviparus]|uniref:Tyrosine-protein kinase n=1 Tax=Dictyocaulus viviparus TaxID=29172 RepID=A0A0D8Y1U4_DICVI|nr:SH2 domain protein [Dictyocaulus viviparus]
MADNKSTMLAEAKPRKVVSRRSKSQGAIPSARKKLTSKEQEKSYTEVDIAVKAEEEKTRHLISSYSDDNDPNRSYSDDKIGYSNQKTGMAMARVQKNRLCLKRVKDFNGGSTASLDDEPFYHGYVSREEAERCVSKDGEFMLRKALVNGKESYIVTVRWETEKLHLKIQQNRAEKLYWLRTFCFNKIQDLIRFHLQVGVPVYRENVILKSYVEREQWQLYHEQIALGDVLGCGEFGLVYKGTLTVGLFTKPQEVAVKTLKSNSLTSDDRVTFLREANVMLKLQHRNVIRLYGVAVQKEPIMIVMEIASGGTLLHKVKKESLDVSIKRKYCYHTVSGMKYLEKEQASIINWENYQSNISQSFLSSTLITKQQTEKSTTTKLSVIHRDLAARNCLVGVGDTCKISDFGLSLLGRLHREKNMTRVPVRWLAPETLMSATYSSKSDVWSYGVLMFEVFSNGRQPYENIKNLKLLRMKVIYENLRLEPPSDMPPEDRNIMTMCFETDPAKRPSFADLKALYKVHCTTPVITKMLGWLNPEKVAVA